VNLEFAVQGVGIWSSKCRGSNILQTGRSISWWFLCDQPTFSGYFPMDRSCVCTI